MSNNLKRLLGDACVDRQPNALPLVSPKDTVGSKATVVTAVLIDGDEAFFDDAATHGRSALEQGITWVASPAEVPNARRVFVVWLFVKPDRQSREYGYHGAVAVDMYIDAQTRRGYKHLAQHARQLGRALKGEVDLGILDAAAKQRLLAALAQYPDALRHANPALKQALGLSEAAEGASEPANA